MQDGPAVYNMGDLEESSDNEGRQWEKKCKGRAPGQRYQANMREAAACGRWVKRYVERSALGRGKMLQAK